MMDTHQTRYLKRGGRQTVPELREEVEEQSLVGGRI